MRTTLRLLASVKAGRYLEAGNPTGLTGLFNHPSPRSTLLYLYGSILDKLKAFPEHSVYRQSTEALTKYRMNIIESIKAEGYEEWAKRAAEKVQKYPEAFQPGGKLEYSSSNGNEFVTTKAFQDEPEGTRSEEEEIGWAGLLKGRPQDYSKLVQWEPEPPLEASQISDAENQIGGGLIEEVIQVAEGELKLVDCMAESKVWEELEEKPPQGQWDYFSRDRHTRTTQEPAKQ